LQDDDLASRVRQFGADATDPRRGAGGRIARSSCG